LLLPIPLVWIARLLQYAHLRDGFNIATERFNKMSANLVSQAAYLLQNGDRAGARQLLAEALSQNPADEQAWLWMSGAVESDKERLDCLQQVLAIDPGNQAALDGLEALSQYERAARTLGSVPAPADASLDAFLGEQETIHSIHRPAPRTLKAINHPAPDTGTTDIGYALTEPTAEDDLAFVTHIPSPASLPEPFSARALALDLSGLLDEAPAPRSALAVNAFHRARRPALIPWRDLPITREQLLLFGLGLIIAFLTLLIGFSILKTVLHGPRVLAAPAPLPTITPQPTPVPEPTPLIFQPTLVSSDCRFNVPAAAQVECLTAILPESRDGSSARSLRSPLVIYRSLNPFPPADPVIYLHGGPGASAIEWAAANFEMFIGPLLYERDVLVFDGRGFGQATPALDCPELLNQLHLELRQEVDLEYRAENYAPAVKACRDRLASQGIRLAQYSTAAMAADVRDIVRLLGYEQVNLYGVSFGASVAQVVLRDDPEILRSLVLDSAFPLQGNFYHQIADGTEEALLALFELCRADSACHSQYPNLEAVFNELSANLADNPFSAASGGSTSSVGARLVVDGVRFQDALRLALLSPALIPDIPRGMYNLRFGDPSFVETVLSAPRMVYADPALGAMISILCTEQAYATTAADLESGLEAYPRTAELARYLLYGSRVGLVEICDQWQAEPFDAQVKLLPHGSTPTLILSGKLDPLFSPDLLAGLASGLQQSVVLEFPGLGHGVSIGGGGACPLSIAVSFLRDPYAEVQTNCVGEMKVPFRER
jgi:pimeloyl-ACP methyl ester carboxylesterase